MMTKHSILNVALTSKLSSLMRSGSAPTVKFDFRTTRRIVQPKNERLTRSTLRCPLSEMSSRTRSNLKATRQKNPETNVVSRVSCETAPDHRRNARACGTRCRKIHGVDKRSAKKRLSLVQPTSERSTGCATQRKSNEEWTTVAISRWSGALAIKRVHVIPVLGERSQTTAVRQYQSRYPKASLSPSIPLRTSSQVNYPA